MNRVQPVQEELPSQSLASDKPLFSVALPMPPSVNACWFNVKGIGRAKTKEYTAWIRAAQYLVLFKVAPIGTPVEIRLYLTFSKAARHCSDISNRIKPAEDLLVSSKVLEDDRAQIVRKVSVELDDSGVENTCRVEVWGYK